MEYFSCIGLFTLRSHWVGEGGRRGEGGRNPGVMGMGGLQEVGEEGAGDGWKD